MLAVLTLASLLAGCDPSLCSEGALTRALAEARAGDVVEVGPCEVRGAFTVPAGVLVRGAGPESVLGSVEGGAPVLDLAPGASTRIEALTLAVDHGGYGVRGHAAQQLVVRAVRVEVTRGIALGFRDSEVSIADVDLRGPITAENAATAPREPALTGAFGLTAVGSSLSVAALRARGFAVGAVALEGGELEWLDPDELEDVEATLGAAIGLFGVTAVLDGVEVSGVLAGFDRPGFAIVAAPSSTGAPTDLIARDVRIANGAGYGVLGHGSDIVLEGVTIDGLGLVGAHVQSGGSLRASDVAVRGSGGAGLVALDQDSIVLERSSFSEQRVASLTSGALTVRAADGVHVRRTSASAPAMQLVASDLVLVDNARAGLLLDGADAAPAQLSLLRVRVSASEPSAYGAIAQRTSVAPDWDAEIVREGVAIANDAGFTGMIDPVGILMPPTLVAFPPAP